MTRKPPTLGAVWTVKARLLNRNKRLVGICSDTPNSIAKALMEHPEIAYVNHQAYMRSPGDPIFEPRSAYASRMADWNVAPSMYHPVSAADKRRWVAEYLPKLSATGRSK